MTKRHSIVMGLDIAAVNSGVCITKATSPSKGAPQFEALLEFGAEHGPLRDHSARARSADMIKGLCIQYNVDFVVLEDYALRMSSTNTSGYQHGEASGMVKKSLDEISMPFIVIPPTSMRSFISVPRGLPDKGKQYIIDYAKEKYGFISLESSQKKRSNATDAFIHSVIGSLLYFHSIGKDLVDLDEAQKVTLLNGNGKKVKGLINMPEIYFRVPWFQGLEK